MKKLLYLLLFLPFLTSCDQVDENDRYIEVAPVQVARRVLLEEFTGQHCTNCPDAHAIIEKLEEQYGDDLVVVSIHAGSFALPSPFGLMQQEGDTYASYWNINAYPAGVVDRTGGATTMDNWSSIIRTDAEKETTLEIDITANLGDDGSTIYITTNLLSSAPLNGSLQLWVTENGIVAQQYSGNQTINDYVHNNVFRGCVNGTWGQEVSLRAGEPQEFENSIDVETVGTPISKWNVENLYIVGFVYNDSGVIQVNKTKVE